MSYNESLNPNSNYPLMTQSQWDSAPFNQEDPPEREFNIAVSCSLSKETTVTTDDYEGGEYDEDGYWCAGDLNNSWNAYTDSEYTVGQIIDFAKHCAEYMLENKDFSLKSKHGLKKMIDSCQGWTVDEENAEQV